MNINQTPESAVDDLVKETLERFGKERGEKILDISRDIILQLNKQFRPTTEFHEALQLIGRLSVRGKQLAADVSGVSVESLDFKPRS